MKINISRNILLKNGRIRLGVLGEAKQIIANIASKCRDSMLYMSPEMHKKYVERTIEINEKTDVWYLNIFFIFIID